MAHGLPFRSLTGLCVLPMTSAVDVPHDSAVDVPDDFELTPAVGEVRWLDTFTQALLQSSIDEQKRMLQEEESQRHVWRCWHWYFAVDGHKIGEILRACRLLLLIAYGTYFNPGSWGSLDTCWSWAAVATPDEGMIRDPQLEHFLQDTYIGTVKWPPLLRRRGGIFFDVGSHTNGEFVAKHLLMWRPHHIHFFEPIPAKYVQLQDYWSSLYKNTTFHNYGLGDSTRFLVPLYDAPVYLGHTSTIQSTFHQFRFADRRIYLDGCKKDAGNVQHAHLNLVTIRSVVDTWQQLNVDKLAVLNINCEGCEYQVIPALARADLLQHIAVIIVQWHTVLDQHEALEAVDEGRCSETGVCQADAVHAALDRYCQVSDILEQTHEKQYGLPFQGYQLWAQRTS